VSMRSNRGSDRAHVVRIVSVPAVRSSATRVMVMVVRVGVAPGPSGLAADGVVREQQRVVARGACDSIQFGSAIAVCREIQTLPVPRVEVAACPARCAARIAGMETPSRCSSATSLQIPCRRSSLLGF
jgi:hypothetical protein